MPLSECLIVNDTDMQAHYKLHTCSPYSVYKDSIVHIGCHCSKVLLSELKLYFFSALQVSSLCHCEGTRFRACDCDVIFICCYTC